MKKVLVLVLCFALTMTLTACSKKKPTCDAEEAKTYLVGEYKRILEVFFGSDAMAVFEKAVTFDVENIETVTADDLQAQCKANLTAKLTNEAALAGTPLEGSNASRFDANEAVSYTVTLSEDKKTLNVEWK